MKSHTGANTKKVIYLRAAKIAAQNNKDLLIEILESQQKLPITASIQQWNAEETKKLIEECDLVMPLLLWDYPKYYTEFLKFMDHLIEKRIPLANDPFIIKWNSDKIYLKDLISRNAALVPTLFIESSSDIDQGLLALQTKVIMREWSEIIIKPTIANSAMGVLRLKSEDYLTKGLPHIKALLSQGYKVLAQPYISVVESAGEISALYFNGKYSHSVRKVPGKGDFRVQNEYGGVDFEYKPSQEEFLFHEKILSTAKESVKAYSKQDYYKHDFLYARIDYFITEDNTPLLSELEVMEPHLFLNIASETSIPNWQNAVVDYLQKIQGTN
jgi:glutathione synthase/RimK-type ligase-like ATP-grasp enzyme